MAFGMYFAIGITDRNFNTGSGFALV